MDYLYGFKDSLGVDARFIIVHFGCDHCCDASGSTPDSACHTIKGHAVTFLQCQHALVYVFQNMIFWNRTIIYNAKCCIIKCCINMAKHLQRCSKKKQRGTFIWNRGKHPTISFEATRVVCPLASDSSLSLNIRSSDGSWIKTTGLPTIVWTWYYLTRRGNHQSSLYRPRLQSGAVPDFPKQRGMLQRSPVRPLTKDETPGCAPRSPPKSQDIL